MGGRIQTIECQMLSPTPIAPPGKELRSGLMADRFSASSRAGVSLIIITSAHLRTRKASKRFRLAANCAPSSVLRRNLPLAISGTFAGG